MNEIEQFLTIAEVSAAPAGFAGIVATFLFGQQANIYRGHVLALSMIVNISLVGAFFSVLPLIFLNCGMAEQDVWSLCSALMGVNISIFIFYIWRTTRLNSLPVYTRAVLSGMRSPTTHALFLLIIRLWRKLNRNRKQQLWTMQ